MSTDKPGVGQTVHYVSHGTPIREDGTQVFTSQCRAAIVTEVGAWVTVAITRPDSYSTSEGRPIRRLEQWYFDDAVGLAVINPTGLFFHAEGGCRHDEGGKWADWSCTGRNHPGGTWHWPVEAT